MVRKKWRLKLLPTFTYRHQPSRKRAYAEVERYRTLYAEGMSRIHHINVEVDEGDGWSLYEKVVFPERALEAVDEA